MKKLFNPSGLKPKGVKAPPKPHLHMLGGAKPINYASVIKNRAMRIGRPKINMGKKHKLFKSPVRIPRGTSI